MTIIRQKKWKKNVKKSESEQLKVKRLVCSPPFLSGIIKAGLPDDHNETKIIKVKVEKSENEGRYISDKIAVSDQIYLNTINKNNLTDTSYPNNSPFQHNIENITTNLINTIKLINLTD